MYLDYFSLNRHPFRITPDPSLFFPGGKDGRGVILDALIYGINSGEGILKVVGEVGSGKTMLCRMLEEELPDTVEIVYLANPSLSAREILYAIAIELKLDVSASTERLKVMHLLQNYLLEKHSKGGAVVMFIEEAQSMPLETLEEIRLLSNLETHQHKLMQIVLFGQPELDRILAQKNIRQLRERITHSFRLEPLSTDATSEYIRYRMGIAGCPWTQLFSPRAVKLIARASSGLTRRINILADKSLLAAYADSPSRQPPQDSGESLVLPRHVRAAIRDSDYRNARLPFWMLWGLGTAGIAALVMAVFAFDLWPEASPPVTPATASVAQGAGNSPLPLTVPPAQPRETAETIDTAQTPQTDAVAEPAEGQAQAQPQAQIQTAQAVGEFPETLPAQGPADSLPVTDAGGAVAEVSEAVTEDNIANLTDDDADMPETIAVVREDVAVDTAESGLTGSSESPDIPDTSASPDSPASSDTPITSEPVALAAAPVTLVPSGLAELRMNPTAQWLRTLDEKTGYAIQLFSVPSTNPSGLEEYLQFLQLVDLLDDTYICFMPVSSPNSGRWQVMHRDFEGVTRARDLIGTLPAYIGQYGPYVRNLDGIECSYPVETENQVVGE